MRRRGGADIGRQVDIMKTEELLDAIGELDEKLVVEAKTEESEQEYRKREGKRNRRRTWLRIGLPVAATAVLAVVLSLVYTLQKPKSDIPEWLEMNGGSATGDRMFYYTLENVEAKADLIVEVTAKEVDSQECGKIYSYAFEKIVPGSGYTRRNCKVTKVYKGEVEEGDNLLVLQYYYIWDYETGDVWDYVDDGDDGASADLGFINVSSQVKPMIPGEKYLLFLSYYENHGGYYPVGDYEGFYAMPTKDIAEKAEQKTLQRTDFDYIFQHDVMPTFLPLYYEVFDKYFKQ